VVAYESERSRKMIRKNLKLLVVTSIVILLPVVAGLFLWDQLPEQIPTHWNTAGEVDSWSSKPFAVFGLPFIMLAIHWVCILGTNADPKKANHPEKVLHLVLWLVPALSVIMSAATYAAALGEDVPMERIAAVVLGLVFTIIGNYMPKCKQNYTIGIKIPWTLNNEENWNRTHRLAGRLWFVCGLVIMLIGFFGGLEFLLGSALVMVVIPPVYSYILHRKGF